MKAIFLVANPESRRRLFFEEAAGRAGWPVTVLPWSDLLEQGCHFLRAVPAGATVRIESPGQNPGVEAQLITRGLREQFPGEEPASPLWEPGLISHQRAWYLGFGSALRALGAAVPAGARWMSHPADIAWLFDKEATRALLAEAGVPVPAGLGLIRDFDDLMDKMRRAKMPRVFLKPCHASSASGVVALETTASGRLRATCAVEMVRGKGGSARLYNNRKLRRYETADEVRALVGALAPQHLTAERWFPKAGFQGRAFDLRVLVIAGEAAHTVVRMSQGPLTNLHLGSRRGDLSALRARLGEPLWHSARQVCQSAAACFPRTHQVAVDLMIGTDWKSLAVAECNAFGDLLPHVLHEGRGTYEEELRRWPT